MKRNEIDKLIYNAQKDNDTDMMVIACDNTNEVHLGMIGDSSKIAEALCATIFNGNNPTAAKQVYNIIKNAVYNIIINPSDWSEDMLIMVAEIADAAARLPFNGITPVNETIN